MRNENNLSTNVDVRTAFSLWAESKNNYFSKVLEKSVSNKQAISIIHCFVAFIFVILSSGSLTMVSMGTLWFLWTLYLAKKSGLN